MPAEPAGGARGERSRAGAGAACCGVSVRCSLYLLHWYKSTHTDADIVGVLWRVCRVLNLLALLVQEYTY